MSKLPIGLLTSGLAIVIGSGTGLAAERPLVLTDRQLDQVTAAGVLVETLGVASSLSDPALADTVVTAHTTPASGTGTATAVAVGDVADAAATADLTLDDGDHDIVVSGTGVGFGDGEAVVAATAAGYLFNGSRVNLAVVQSTGFGTGTGQAGSLAVTGGGASTDRFMIRTRGGDLSNGTLSLSWSRTFVLTLDPRR